MREVYRYGDGGLWAQPPEEFLSELLGAARVIALVGAGGKTSLLYALAERGARLGRRAVVTTTTHIFCPEDGSFCADLPACEERWSAGKYAVWGVPAADGKLTGLSAEDFVRALTADTALVEADGAKRLPCKAPAAHEPVIPAQVELVVGVMGLSALGRTVAESSFRPELVAAFLGCEPDHRLTPADLAALLCSERGTRKGVGARPYWAVLNQYDAVPPALGREALELLHESGVQGALTCFSEG